jgi:tetratricopeptide (TPR) repeat protein
MAAESTNKFWFPLGALMGVVLWVYLCGGISAWAASGPVPKSVDARHYEACMALARQDPKAAHESARAWWQNGGGDAAAHCVAVALLGLGQHHLSGQMLEDLANRTNAARGALKAGLLSQAANAWLIAGQVRKSEKLLTDALVLAPKNVEILIDRSAVLATQQKFFDALDDLNVALEEQPKRVDALTFRASAWRRVDAFDLAEKDVAAALKHRPDYPEALLERGLIRKARGNWVGAQADWQRVLDIAEDGPLTEAARYNLDNLKLNK